MELKNILRRGIILLLFSAFIAALASAISKLMNPPVGITFEKSNDGFMPHITACAYFTNNSYKLGEDLSFDEVMEKLPSLKKYITFTTTNISASMELQEKVEESIQLWDFQTNSPVKCLTYKPPIEVEKAGLPSPYQSMVSMRIAMDVPFMSIIRFHDANTPIHTLRSKPALFDVPSLIPYYREYQLVMSKEKFIQSCKEMKNDLKEPSKCLNNAIIDELKCSLPWMPIQNGIKVCKSREEYKEYLNILDRIWDSTCAPMNCTQHSWTFQKTFDVSKDDDKLGFWTDNLQPFTFADFSIMFYLGTKEVSVTQQVEMYEFSSFIADFGGYLGLLLGASLLSIYDEFIEICKCIQERINSPT